MAFEARRPGQFPPVIIGNRDLMGFGGMGYGVVDPVSEAVVPMYGSAVCGGPRKRERKTASPPVLSSESGCGVFSLLGEEFAVQFQQQQLEIDRFIALHTEKVRVQIESRLRKYTRRTLEENTIKKLKAKEEEIEKIGKLNWALEERVKSLSLENQIWKDLAQTNEATANALRSNLQQVLCQVHEEKNADDAESCSSAAVDSRLCRRCGKEESSVLLLPCRHLCMCTVCVSSLHTCPVCDSVKTATVHVNFAGV